MKFLKYIVLVFVFITGANYISAKDMDLSLTEAINKNLVKITTVSTGQLYNANALNIIIENTGKKALNITIDPALIFTSTDTIYPDLLVSGNTKVNVQPAATANVVLQTYATRSNASIPIAKLTYTFSKQADSNIIKLLDHIKDRNINTELAQKAVWVLIQHRNVNTVYDPTNDIASKNLALYLATLTKQSMPAFYKYFPLNVVGTTNTASQPITTVKPLQIFAFFKWIQKEDADLSLIVTDEKGKTIQILFEKQLFKKGGYELTGKFESADVESGTYFIRLAEGNTVLKEIKVDVD